MAFRIVLTTAARDELEALAATNEVKHRKVRRTLGLLEVNPRYGGLNSHKYETLKGPSGEDVWESYVENNTPAAFRVFWVYGPEPGMITILRITPHP